MVPKLRLIVSKATFTTVVSRNTTKTLRLPRASTRAAAFPPRVPLAGRAATDPRPVLDAPWAGRVPG